MMQFVALRDIKEGMCVSENVCDDQGRTLIARGQLIGPHHIARLRKFRIESLFIDPHHGESVVKPTKTELRERCVEVMKGSFSQISGEFNEKRVALDAAAIKDVSARLVDALMESKNPLVTLLDISAGPDKTMQHSVNTAVLAVVLAIDMHIPEPMLRELAVAMMFHDVGAIFLPDELVRKTSPLNAQEIQMMRQHVHLGCEHLLRSDAIGSVAANIILRHHETIDGAGYPNGVPDEKLTTLMKIAHVVEIYDTLTTGRPWMPAVLPDIAISYIISNAGRLFAKDVVIKLCQRIALYPVGSAVQLTTGECGIVAGILPKAPTRPVLLVHYDHRGNPLKSPMVVDLMRDLNRAVVRSAATLPQLLQAKSGELILRPVDPTLANLG